MLALLLKQGQLCGRAKEEQKGHRSPIPPPAVCYSTKTHPIFLSTFTVESSSSSVLYGCIRWLARPLPPVLSNILNLNHILYSVSVSWVDRKYYRSRPLLAFGEVRWTIPKYIPY